VGNHYCESVARADQVCLLAYGPNDWNVELAVATFIHVKPCFQIRWSDGSNFTIFIEVILVKVLVEIGAGDSVWQIR
jgi:hypothetical protein